MTLLSMKMRLLRRFGSSVPRFGQFLLGACTLLVGGYFPWAVMADELRVGVGAAELQAEDSMVIAGGITAGKVAGQEGKLRCTAMVFELGNTKIGMAACDVLMLTRQTLDPVVAQVSAATGIPSTHILINCTHTHHAPSTMRVHDYGPDAAFTERVQRGLLEAFQKANDNLGPGTLYFAHGEETKVGQNSRMLLDDGQIYWIGPRTNVVRATSPFDPDLPVMAFRDERDQLKGLVFNHSTHSIGARQPGRRSPSIYGMAAQDLERQLGGIALFFEGASGSTHNLELTGEECIRRIKASVFDTLQRAQAQDVKVLRSAKKPIRFRVRRFDDAAEDAAVARYVHKYVGAPHDEIIRKVFQNMRRELSPVQGEERETWVQAIRIGNVAWVGVPAEYFTQLGLDIKNRSPFRHTYVAELANDWIGYLPNREGHKLGGYQVWTGFHSYAEPGTGERIADLAIELLKGLEDAK
jgi:hypothetical protein